MPHPFSPRPHPVPRPARGGLARATLMLITLGAVAAASETAPSRPWAISGTVEAGMLAARGADRLDPNASDARIRSSDAPRDAHAGATPLLLFNLQVRNQGPVQYFARTPTDSYGLAVGATFPAPPGRVEAEVCFALPQEVWQDPYRTDSERERTQRTSYGAGLALREIGGSPVALTYQLRVVSVEEDRSGERHPALRRDGQRHELGAETDRSFGPLRLTPRIAYAIGEHSGEAASYDAVHAQLQAGTRRRHYALTLSGQLEARWYRARHPVFDQRREDLQSSLSLLLTWMAPFGIERTYLNLLGGASWRTATIDFYDSHSYFTGLTIGRAF